MPLIPSTTPDQNLVAIPLKLHHLALIQADLGLTEPVCVFTDELSKLKCLRLRLWRNIRNHDYVIGLMEVTSRHRAGKGNHVRVIEV